MSDDSDQTVLHGAPVTAAEFVRNFARLREEAQHHPVYISNHGRVSHVLATLADFRRVTATTESGAAGRQVSLFGLAEWVDDAILVCNAQEEVIYANRVASAICRLDLPPGETLPLRTALPAMYDTLIEVHFRRTQTTREPSTADLPSPFVPGAWLHMRCFPLRENTVLMVRDITFEVERFRLADVKKAMVDAMSLHGGVGYVRLSPRGTIETVDDAFCQWVGLAENKLTGVPLLDLVDRTDRVGLRDGLEKVFAQGKTVRCVVDLVPNRAEKVTVDCAAVPLQGTYGAQGAVVVFTKHRDDFEYR